MSENNNGLSRSSAEQRAQAQDDMLQGYSGPSTRNHVVQGSRFLFNQCAHCKGAVIYHAVFCPFCAERVNALVKRT